MDCKTEITHHFGVLNLKTLVPVFAPLRPFATQISQELNVPISAHQSFWYEVQFSAPQSFFYEVQFSAPQSFLL